MRGGPRSPSSPHPPARTLESALCRPGFSLQTSPPRRGPPPHCVTRRDRNALWLTGRRMAAEVEREPAGTPPELKIGTDDRIWGVGTSQSPNTMAAQASSGLGGQGPALLWGSALVPRPGPWWCCGLPASQLRGSFKGGFLQNGEGCGGPRR